MKQFSIVLPIRDTPEEREFMIKSLPSAIELEPEEIIFGLDDTARPELAEKIKRICLDHNYQNFRIIKIKETDDWHFQLANIIWHCYQEAKYDIILSFDVDSVLRKTVLMGLEQIGKDHVAVVSFTKRIRIKNITELKRHIFYRIRVMSSSHVFSGIYFVYRPYFFEIVNLDEYKAMVNGVDVYLVDKVLPDTKYKLITNKQIGVDCLDEQNEDYPWRQFQMGIWVQANTLVPIYGMKDYWEKWSKLSRKEKLTKFCLNAPIILLSYILQDPDYFIRVKSFVYGHPYLRKGYFWANKNSNHIAVIKARELSWYDYGMTGGTYLPKFDWKREGTGFHVK